MIKIALCDNETVHKDFLRHIITAILNWLQEEDYRIWTYTSAHRLLESPNKYHIVFLEINLDNDVDGIKIAHKLRKKGGAQILILVSSMHHRMAEGYRAKALRFLLKPLEPNEIAEAVIASLEELRTTPDKLVTRFRNITNYIPLESIYYLESYYRRKKIYTTSGIYETNQKWQELNTQLPKHQYFKVNQSYHVNLAMVRKISPTDVTMDNGQVLTFRRGLKKDFEMAFHYYTAIQTPSQK